MITTAQNLRPKVLESTDPKVSTSIFSYTAYCFSWAFDQMRRSLKEVPTLYRFFYSDNEKASKDARNNQKNVASPKESSASFIESMKSIFSTISRIFIGILSTPFWIFGQALNFVVRNTLALVAILVTVPVAVVEATLYAVKRISKIWSSFRSRLASFSVQSKLQSDPKAILEKPIVTAVSKKETEILDRAIDPEPVVKKADAEPAVKDPIEGNERDQGVKNTEPATLRRENVSVACAAVIQPASEKKPILLSVVDDTVGVQALSADTFRVALQTMIADESSECYRVAQNILKDYEFDISAMDFIQIDFLDVNSIEADFQKLKEELVAYADISNPDLKKNQHYESALCSRIVMIQSIAKILHQDIAIIEKKQSPALK